MISSAVAAMPDTETLYDLADFFKVLGDSTRTAILFAVESGELCVLDVSAALGMTKSAVSHQLSALRRAGLVKHRREGKHVYYSLADDHVRDIIDKALEHIRE